MGSRLEAARRFLAPIDDAQVPGINGRIAVTGRIIAVLYGTFAVITHATDMVIGGNLVAQVGLLAVVVGICAAMFHALGTAWGERNAQRLLTALCTWVMIGFIVRRELSTMAGNPTLGYVSLMPTLFSAMIPWKPRCAALAGGVATALSAGALAAWYTLPLGENVLYLSLAVGNAVCAPVLAHGQRRIWRDLERAQATGRLAASDRITHLGRLSATLAHELKTPLASAMNQLDVVRSLNEELLESFGHPEVTTADLREIVRESAESAAGAKDGVNRAARIVRSMRDQTRVSGPESGSRIDVAVRMESNRRLLNGRLRAAGVALVVEPTELELWGPALQFDQVLVNLVRNAIDALEEGGGSEIRVSASPRDGGWMVVVQDDGPGVPADRRDRIFEQGFSTKGPDQGLGLGLWLCRNLVQVGFGGTLELAPSDVGARFELFFPAGNAERRAASAASAA